MKKITSELPGFSDWRGNVRKNDAGRQGGNYISHRGDGSIRRNSGISNKNKPRNRDKSTRRRQRDALPRKYKQIHTHSSSLRSSSTASTSGNNDDRLQSSFNSSSGAGSNNKNIKVGFKTDALMTQSTERQLSMDESLLSAPSSRKPSTPTTNLETSLQTFSTEETEKLSIAAIPYESRRLVSKPSVDTSLQTFTTEETNKFNNTSREAYRKLYETVRKETEEDNAACVKWVGLGDASREKNTDTTIKEEQLIASVAQKKSFHLSSSDGSGNCNKSPKKSASFHGTKKSHSFHSTTEGSNNYGTSKRNHPSAKKSSSFHDNGSHHHHHHQARKSSSFHDNGSYHHYHQARKISSFPSSSTDNKPRKDKVLVPNTPNVTLALDEMIDELHVEEILLEEDGIKMSSSSEYSASDDDGDDHYHESTMCLCPTINEPTITTIDNTFDNKTTLVKTPDPKQESTTVCVRNSQSESSLANNVVNTAPDNGPCNKNDPAKSSNEKATVVRKSRKKRLEKSDSAIIDHWSVRLKDATSGKNTANSDSNFSKHYEKKHNRQQHRKSRRARSPTIGKRESGSDRDLHAPSGISSDASVTSQQSNRSDQSISNTSRKDSNRTRSRSGSRRRMLTSFVGGTKDDDNDDSEDQTKTNTTSEDRTNDITSKQQTRSRSRSGSRLRMLASFVGSTTGDDVGGDDLEGRAKTTNTSNDGVNAAKQQQKKGLFRKIKKLAGKVKNTLGELGGISSVHKYRLEERARYRIAKAPRCLRTYDPKTMTVEVEIVTVHIDAVLEMPYYTIVLPDDTRKQTNWDNLMSLAEYERRLATSRIDDSYRGGDDTEASSSRRYRSLSRSRGSSRRRGRERSATSRQDDSCKQRSSSRGDEYKDSTSIHESFGSFSPRKSSRFDSSRRSSPKGRRPRSPSPFSKRESQDESHHLSVSKKRSSRSKPRELSPSLVTKTPRPSTDPSKDTRTLSNHYQS